MFCGNIWPEIATGTKKGHMRNRAVVNKPLNAP
jgi:hypothetical protein